MAEFKNELQLDISGFLKSIKKALGASDDLTDLDVKMDVDTSELNAAAKKVKALDGETVTVPIDADTSGLESSMKSATDNIKDQLKGAFESAKGGDLGGLADIGATLSGAIPALGAATAAIGAVGAVLGDTIAKGREFNEALRQVSLQTGLTGDDLEAFEDQAKQAFVLGVGESAAESAKILGTLKQTLGDAFPTDQLAKVAVQADQVSKSLGVETPEVLAKISPLMKQYGKTAEEALALVSGSAQDGVQDIGGFLDATQEFAPNFKEAGFSAEELFALLQNGAANGIKDFAKIGDGVKEVENRIKSGDLAAQFAAVGGEIGNQLRDVVKLGEEGVIQGKDVLQQSIGSISQAFADGKIDQNTRDKLLTSLGGSIAEDLGSEMFTNIFDPKNLDTEKIAASAKAAGKQINDNIPPPSISAIFENVQTEIGQFFDDVYRNVVGPFITPLVDAFTRVKDALANVFSGDVTASFDVFGGVVDALADAFDVVLTVVTELIEFALTPLRAIFDAVKASINPVLEALSGLFEGSGEGIDIFGTLKNVIQTVADVFSDVLYFAIRLVYKPLELLGKGVALLIGFIKDVVTTIADWVMGLEFVQDAIAFVSAAVDAFVKSVKAVGDAVGGFLESIGLLDSEADAAAEAVAEVGDAADETGDQVRSAADDVNALARAFNESLSAAQGQLATLQAAGAASGKFGKEIAKAAAAVRKLEAAQDAAALAGDPARQRAIQDSIAQAIAETARLDQELTASRIINAQERERALLKIQQDADNAAIDAQISTQKKLIAIGGSGLPEARAALKALEEQKKRIASQGSADLIALDAQFQAERLTALQANEGLILQAFNALNARVIAQAQKQLDARNFTQGNIDAIVNANVKAIQAGADAEVRALVESLPEFTKARDEINKALLNKDIDADEAQKQIKALLASFQNNLLADTGDNPIGQQVRAIFANADDAVRDATKSIKQSIQDVGIQALSSDILKGIDEQVVALERQRDILLLNTELTEAQRAEIEGGYAKAIDKVRKGPLVGLRQSVLSIGEAIAGAQFDLGGEEAAQDAAAVKEQVDAINEALRAGDISYQEALDQINALQSASEDFLSTFGTVLAQSLQATSDAVAQAAQASIDAYNNLIAEQDKVRKDDTLSEEKRTEELARLSELTADQQAKALESIGTAAGANFATMLAQGTEVGEALKTLASDTVKSLIALYTPTIIAASTSFLGPIAGPIAAGLAIAGIQALLDSALASFDEGGATGGRIGEVRGIVHGGEWVARPEIYKENKALFDHLHKGGNAMDYLGRSALSSSPSYAVNESGNLVTIMSQVKDTLSSLPALVEVRQTDNVTLGLDDRLYEQQRHRRMVRRLTR